MIDPTLVERRVNRIKALSLQKSQELALEVLAKPPLFDIEVASSCNLTCVFCPRDEMHRHAKIMDPKIFESIFNFLPDSATVMFAGVGEPLLNKHLERYIKMLKGRGISSCVITNGILLTPERQTALIEAGISQIQISYHAEDETALHEILSTTKYKDLIKMHLRHLSVHRPESLRVQINFVLTEDNRLEQEKVYNLAKQLGFTLYGRRVHNRGGSLASRTLNPLYPENPSSCGIFAAVTFISSDGKILSCSNDVQGNSFFKCVHETSWEEVLAWKQQILVQGLTFKACYECNDDYRWIILDNLSVDEKKEIK